MNSQREIQAILFDLDGTLADTFPLIVSAWNASVGKYYSRKYSDEEVISRFGIPDPQMIRRELPAEVYDRVLSEYHANYQAGHGMVRPFAGVNEMLAELRRREVPIGLMTGKGKLSAMITLRELGWSEMFAAVVTGDDVPNQKPDPTGVLRVAERLRAAAQACAFVGDAPVDILAGRNARMLTVAAGWHPVYADAMKALSPDVWAKTPADVVKLVREARNPDV